MRQPKVLTRFKKFHGTDFSGDNTEYIALVVVIIVAFIGLYFGWRLFWYLTDDAFIAFRYVSNSILGYGYVWNPPPFKPIEGYTSFLWILVLDIVWRTLGVMPPDSANWISFCFASFTLVISMVMFYKFDWNPAFMKYRLVFLVIFLVAVLANRTFLAWTSSGLETSMFNFFVIYWVFSSCYLHPYSRRWMWGVSVSTTLVSLTRPDGLLFTAATILMMVSVLSIKRWEKKNSQGDLWAFLPMAIIPLHLLWRVYMYGEWLPNTYYAKSSPDMLWVTSGTYYFLSFVIEYALWFYFVLVIIFLGRAINRWRGSSAKLIPTIFEGSNLVKLISLFAVFAHFVYYTLVIGGDHFEFRVYSHFIVLIFLSAVWILNYTATKPVVASMFYAIFVLASFPIPWGQWYFAQRVTTREEAVGMTISISGEIQQSAPNTPNLVISYLRLYDDLQSWLAHHFVCIRHQEHKVFWQSLIDDYPSRDVGSLITSDDFPVVQRRSIGVLAWVLPHVNVIDKWGLNDYVVARNPDLFPGMLMAHLRQPPDGYVECFEPNVTIIDKTVTVVLRVEPMTAERIINCEALFLQRVNEALEK